MRHSLLLPILALSAFAHAQGKVATLQIKGRSGLIMDQESGRILWSKNADKKRYPASTTKIMTAVILLEQRKLNEMITAAADVKSIGGSSLHLVPGEQISTEDALYAMMLRSANDVCHSVAVELAGSETEFAAMMNAKAAELGMSKTHFVTPHGLPNPEHKTTATDMAKLARYAMNSADFRKIVAARKRPIQRTKNQEDLMLVSRNKWLFKDSTADGIKTGYTDDAGHCYVGSVTRNGFRVITVIFGSPDTQVDHQAMVDWAYKHYQIGFKKEAKEPVLEAKVEGGMLPDVRVGFRAPVQLLNRRGAVTPLSLRFNETIPAPIKQNQLLGQAEAIDADGVIVEVPLIALDDVPQRRRGLGLPGLGSGTVPLGVGLLSACALMVLRKKRRRF